MNNFTFDMGLKHLSPDIQNNPEIVSFIKSEFEKKGIQSIFGLYFNIRSPVCFIDTLSGITTKSKEFELYEFQKEVLESLASGDDAVIVHGKNMGMSTILVLYTLWLAFTDAGSTVAFISPDVYSAEYTIDAMLTIMEESEISFKKSGTTIILENTSMITFNIPTKYSLHGLAINHLIIEDASRISANMNDTLYEIIMFGVSGQSVLSGTGGDYRTLLADMVSNRVIPKIHEYNWSFNPNYDMVWADNKVKAIGMKQFRKDYECEFS